MNEVEIAAVRSAFATASLWSEWCTIAVTIGVFVEFLALFIFSRNMPRSEKWVMGAATAIIVVGCGGEYVFGGRASVAATQLQNASDVQIKALRFAAETAKSEIADAQRGAAIANDRAGQADKAAGEANERAAHIQTEAVITEGRLLGERRLTARERMVVQFVWRAVVPRSELLDRDALVTALKVGKFARTNLAITTEPEPQLFGLFLMTVLQDAGVLGRVVNLPRDRVESGLLVASPNPAKDSLGKMLWQSFQIGGGVVSLELEKKLIPALSFMPDDEDCLIVGEKNEAMQSMPGQPGEGVDRYGGADPAPH